MDLVSSTRCFAGTQRIYSHHSSTLACKMPLSVYVPDVAADAPAVIWLSGLTCTEENFTTKAGAQRVASELGVVLIAPDTSPRGDGVPDDPDAAYDFGLGAGFYVDATETPWHQHYQMRSYIENELCALVSEAFPIDNRRLGIMGHSMGGHGALTIALRNPGRFNSVSAFAPICAPMQCPWGEKALGGYLGSDRATWRAYDACALIEDGARVAEILVDQGADDGFVDEQLKPHLLERACRDGGINLTLRSQPGFDHSYYFIASFIEDHLRWHAERL
ncbi:MAG: S-formylglutathione hydrolase [Gammaproteobacteria bacterium]|nr:S-formylglutathione hydrolase [Gammaproteobacteria bacterium]